jgi:hypothetical protein
MMRLYGLKREEVWTDDWALSPNWSGKQSRKVARRRKKDKKLFHRIGRRTYTFETE